MKAAVHLRLKHDSIKLLLARAAASGAAQDLSEQERGIALYEYDGGAHYAGRFCGCGTRECQLFDRLIEQLRIKYEGRVNYFKEHLKEAVREAA